MHSFILVFKRLMRSYLLWMGLAVLLAFGLCTIYSTRWDPELRFWKQAYSKKMAWSDQLQVEGGAKIVFAGGSSCTFSVRPDLFKQAGINCVNMGGHAGMGALFLCGVAMESLNEGDTLILALEPGLLAGEKIVPRKLGTQTATVLGDKDLAVAEKITGRKLSLQEWGGAMRPGGRHMVTMLSKLMLRRPLYRYSVDELGPGGWAHTSYKDEVALPTGVILKEPVLSVGGTEFLRAVKQHCDAQGVRVAYAIPWVLTESNAVDNNRAHYKGLAEKISKILPVLNAPSWGAMDRQDLFADTALHLTPEGARIRTQELLDVITMWDILD